MINGHLFNGRTHGIHLHSFKELFWWQSLQLLVAENVDIPKYGNGVELTSLFLSKVASRSEGRRLRMARASDSYQ